MQIILGSRFKSVLTSINETACLRSGDPVGSLLRIYVYGRDPLQYELPSQCRTLQYRPTDLFQLKSYSYCIHRTDYRLDGKGYVVTVC
jgi:hypothetical protein